ncbi:hypothetical protein LTR94_037040, partial [Friedmanniomyces endolithicus]
HHPPADLGPQGQAHRPARPGRARRGPERHRLLQPQVGSRHRRQVAAGPRLRRRADPRRSGPILADEDPGRFPQRRAEAAGRLGRRGAR